MCLVANILCDNAKKLALGSPENGKKLLLEKSSKMRQMALDFQNLVPPKSYNSFPGAWGLLCLGYTYDSILKFLNFGEEVILTDLHLSTTQPFKSILRAEKLIHQIINPAVSWNNYYLFQ